MKAVVMTKNRKHKQSIRTAAAEAGINYTTARRAAETGPSDARAALGPYAFRFGSDPFDGRPAYVNLGGPNDPPATFVGGYTGSGKTVVVNQLASVFLDHNPTGRVVWLDPKGVGPCYQPLGDRATILTRPSDPATLDTITSLFDTATAAEPALVVVEEAELVLAPDRDTQGGSDDLRHIITQVARTGRSRSIRLLLTGQRPPCAARIEQSIRHAIHTRIWVAHATPTTWSEFFDSDNPWALRSCADLPRGHGWIQLGSTSPQPIVFPAPDFTS